MTFDQAIYYPMPVTIRGDKTLPKYQELRVLVSTALIAFPLMLLFPIFVHYMGKPIAGYLVNDMLNPVHDPLPGCTTGIQMLVSALDKSRPFL